MVAVVSRVGAVCLAVSLCLLGCGSDDGEPAESEACAGVADRWARLAQEYLDAVGDAGLGELDAGSERIDAAIDAYGAAFLEQIRDAEAVGCTETLTAGSDALCRRADRLSSGGEVAELFVEQLRSNCS